jgi:hypothetical protein
MCRFLAGIADIRQSPELLEKLPGAQGRGLAVPGEGQKKPAGQSVQLIEPVGANVDQADKELDC